MSLSLSEDKMPEVKEESKLKNEDGLILIIGKKRKQEEKCGFGRCCAGEQQR